jgi:hypothetical protein
MNDAHKLVRQIRDHLTGAAPIAPVETMAADYARLCQDAATRLDTCAAMLAKGSDYQALQLAESEPALLDQLASLSFGEARQWVELCAKRGLAFPPPFDTRAVDTLDALYRRGVPANHPLYRDYRAAVTARDDARALAVIRTITRLNPGDANAKAELARLENKSFQALKQRLHSALAAGDESTTLATLDELERIPAARELPGTPDYDNGLKVRRATASRAAAAESAQSANELPAQRSAGDWRAAAALLGRVDALRADHGFALAADAESICSETRTWVESERSRMEATMQFDAAVSRLGAKSAQAEGRIRAGTPLTPSDAADMLLELERAWKEVEAFGRPVGEEVLRAARAAAGAVRAERQRLQRSRVVKVSVSAVLAVILATAGGWWAWRVQRAGDFQSQLAQLQSTGEVEAAERLIASLRTEHAGLAGRARLLTQIEQTEAWSREMRRRQASATEALGALEREAGAQFATSDPAATWAQFDALTPQLSTLPAGMRAGLEARLTGTRTEFEGWLASRREIIAQQAATELAKLETATQEKLRLDLAAEALTTTLAELEPEIRAFDARTRPPVPALELPAPLVARFTGVRQRANLIRTELETLSRNREALAKAASLEEFRTALEAFKDSQLTQSPEVLAAGKLAAQLPSTDSLLAGLLMPDDPVSWEAAKHDPDDPWKPKDVVPYELDRFFALRDDPALSNIHEATLVEGGARRAIYYQGELGFSQTGDGAAVERTWKGKFFDPKLPSVTFLQKSFTARFTVAGRAGDELLNPGPSAAMQAFQELELEKMTDAEGATYEQRLMQKIQRVAAHKKSPPLFRAYLFVKLCDILELRPNAWGLEYCRSLRGDLAEMRRLTAESPLRSTDWMRSPAQRAPREAALKPLLERLASRRYYDEARACHGVVKAARKAGIRLGGYVEANGRPRLLGEAQAGFALWTLDSQVKLSRQNEKPAHPLSPVFFVPLRTTALLADARNAYGDGLTPEFIASIPLLAAPESAASNGQYPAATAK